MHPQEALLAGASIGLTVAAPVGPMAVIVIHRTLTNGFSAGLASGAGASTIHLLYAILALLGIQRLSTMLEAHRGELQAVAALVLLVFALRTLRRRVRPDRSASANARSLLADYVSAIAFNSINPLGFILLLGAIAAMTGLAASGPSATWALAAGVFIGSISWWFVLVITIAVIGLRFSSTRARSVNLVAASIMIMLAVSMIARLLTADLVDSLLGRLPILFASGV